MTQPDRLTIEAIETLIEHAHSGRRIILHEVEVLEQLLGTMRENKRLRKVMSASPEASSIYNNWLKQEADYKDYQNKESVK